MAYSDHDVYGYELATAGRVYPKAEPVVVPFDRKRAASATSGGLLVKPSQYKSLNDGAVYLTAAKRGDK